jgi:hypothetical protein
VPDTAIGITQIRRHLDGRSLEAIVAFGAEVGFNCSSVTVFRDDEKRIIKPDELALWSWDTGVNGSVLLILRSGSGADSQSLFVSISFLQDGRSDRIVMTASYANAMRDAYPEEHYDVWQRLFHFLEKLCERLDAGYVECGIDEHPEPWFEIRDRVWKNRPHLVLDQWEDDVDEEPSLHALVGCSNGRIIREAASQDFLYFPVKPDSDGPSLLRHCLVNGTLLPTPRGEDLHSPLLEETDLEYRRICWPIKNGLAGVIDHFGEPDVRLGPLTVSKVERINYDCVDIVDQVVYETIDETQVVFFRQLETGRVTVAFAGKPKTSISVPLEE